MLRNTTATMLVALAGISTVLVSCTPTPTPTPRAQLYDAAVRADHPYAYWPMQETNGDLTEDVVGDMSFIATNVTRGEPLGPFPNSVSTRFNRSSVHLETFSDGFPTPSFTVEAWVSTTTTLFDNGYASIYGNAWYGLTLAIDSGSGKPFVDGWCDCPAGASDRRVDGDVPITDGKWHHLAATFGAGRLTLYVDGGAVGSTQFNGTVKNNGGYSAIGGRGHPVVGNRNLYQGRMAHLAFYDRALPEASVVSHYEASGISGAGQDWIQARFIEDGGISWADEGGATMSRHLPVGSVPDSQPQKELPIDGLAMHFQSSISGLHGDVTFGPTLGARFALKRGGIEIVGTSDDSLPKERATRVSDHAMRFEGVYKAVKRYESTGEVSEGTLYVTMVDQHAKPIWRTETKTIADVGFDAKWGVVELAGFIKYPASQVLCTPEDIPVFGGICALEYQGDDRTFTPQTLQIPEARSRAYVRIDFPNNRVYMRMHETCTTDRECWEAFPITWNDPGLDAPGFGNDNEFTLTTGVEPNYGNQRFVKLSFEFMQGDRRLISTAFRPGVEGILYLYEDGGWRMRHDCFPSFQLRRTRPGAGQSTELGFTDDLYRHDQGSPSTMVGGLTENSCFSFSGLSDNSVVHAPW